MPHCLELNKKNLLKLISEMFCINLNIEISLKKKFASKNKHGLFFQIYAHRNYF